MQGIIESDTVFRMASPAAVGNGNLLNFAPATAGVLETLTFMAEQSGTVYLRMTWSSPAWSVHSKLASVDLDIYVTDSSGNIASDSVDDQSQAGFDPIELVAMNVVVGQQHAVLGDKYSGTAPKYVQINAPVGAVSFDQSLLTDEYSSVYGNALAGGAICDSDGSCAQLAHPIATILLDHQQSLSYLDFMVV